MSKQVVLTREDIAGAIWMQNESAYLYEMMDAQRNKHQESAKDSLTVRLQEQVAHSARMARKCMGLE